MKEKRIEQVIENTKILEDKEEAINRNRAVLESNGESLFDDALYTILTKYIKSTQENIYKSLRPRCFYAKYNTVEGHRLGDTIYVNIDREGVNIMTLPVSLNNLRELSKKEGIRFNEEIDDLGIIHSVTFKIKTKQLDIIHENVEILREEKSINKTLNKAKKRKRR